MKSKTTENSALDRYQKFSNKWNNQKMEYTNQLDIMINQKPYSQPMTWKFDKDARLTDGGLE